MEQRLFIAACIMYLFAWVSRRLFRKNKLDKPSAFGIWHAGFLLLILGCAYYIFSFIMNSSAPIPQEGVSADTGCISVWLFLCPEKECRTAPASD